MSILPRRRTFLFKLVLLVPTVWFCVVLVLAYQERSKGGGSAPADHNDRVEVIRRVEERDEEDRRKRDADEPGLKKEKKAQPDETVKVR